MSCRPFLRTAGDWSQRTGFRSLYPSPVPPVVRRVNTRGTTNMAQGRPFGRLLDQAVFTDGDYRGGKEPCVKKESLARTRTTRLLVRAITLTIPTMLVTVNQPTRPVCQPRFRTPPRLWKGPDQRTCAGAFLPKAGARSRRNLPYQAEPVLRKTLACLGPVLLSRT